MIIFKISPRIFQLEYSKKEQKRTSTKHNSLHSLDIKDYFLAKNNHFKEVTLSHSSHFLFTLLEMYGTNHGHQQILKNWD